MNSHQLINQTSGAFEYYTPANILEAARRVMGGIDLDPASSSSANKTVEARHFYAIADDGLSKPWYGKVWLNWPFGRGEKACPKQCRKKTCKQRGFCINKPIPGNVDWVDKFVSSFQDRNIKAGMCICYASTSEKWFQPLLDFPQCFISGRVNYLLPDGTVMKGNTKGSVVTYLGYNTRDFILEFRDLGTVKFPYWDTTIYQSMLPKELSHG